MNIINKKLVGYFVDVIGYIDIVLEFECFNDYRDDYVMIRSELLKWVKEHYKNKSFDCLNSASWSISDYSLVDIMYVPRGTKIGDDSNYLGRIKYLV